MRYLFVAIRLILFWAANTGDILFYLSSHYYTKSEAVRKERKNKAFPIVRALENKVYVAKADAMENRTVL